MPLSGIVAAFTGTDDRQGHVPGNGLAEGIRASTRSASRAMSPQPQLAPVTSLRDGPLGEPISPELVLVDPVLAERVRAIPEPSPSWRRLGVAPSPRPSPVVERPDDSPALEPPRVVEPGVAEPVSLRAPPAVAMPPAATESDGVAVPIEAPMVPAHSPEAEPPRIVTVEPPSSSEPPHYPTGDDHRRRAGPLGNGARSTRPPT